MDRGDSTYRQGLEDDCQRPISHRSTVFGLKPKELLALIKRLLASKKGKEALEAMSSHVPALLKRLPGFALGVVAPDKRTLSFITTQTEPGSNARVLAFPPQARQGGEIGRKAIRT